MGVRDDFDWRAECDRGVKDSFVVEKGLAVPEAIDLGFSQVNAKLSLQI